MRRKRPRPQSVFSKNSCLYLSAQSTLHALNLELLVQVLAETFNHCFGNDIGTNPVRTDQSDGHKRYSSKERKEFIEIAERDCSQTDADNLAGIGDQLRLAIARHIYKRRAQQLDIACPHPVSCSSGLLPSFVFSQILKLLLFT